MLHVIVHRNTREIKVTEIQRDRERKREGERGELGLAEGRIKERGMV